VFGEPFVIANRPFRFATCCIRAIWFAVAVFKAALVRIGTDPLLATTVGSTVVDQLARRYARIVFHLMATQPAMLHRELAVSVTSIS
jgi:hypothetical protein